MGLDLSHFKPILKKDNEEYIDFISVETLSINNYYLEINKKFISTFDFGENEQEDIIYFESIGSQRKGMKDLFYSDFSNDNCYFELKDFLKAYQYLKADHISSLKELQQNFETNFIEKFEQGKSILFVSW